MNAAEIQVALEAFNLLEPEIQAGIVALYHLMHKNAPTAADYIAQAQALLAKLPTSKETK